MNDEELAALAGFTVAFFKADSELWSLFQKAKRENYSGQRLLAEARNTKWFEKHNEAQRQAQLLKTSDPAEWKRRLRETRDKLWTMARQSGLGMGSSFSPVIESVAEMALTGGWTEERMLAHLHNAALSDIKARIADPNRRVRGRVAEAEQLMRSLSANYGIKISDSRIGDWAAKFARGILDEGYIRNHFIQQAKQKYAGIANDIDAGMTVRQIAEPYMNAMAEILEINPGEIDLYDKKVKKALTFRDQNNKAAAQPLWAFEQELREDPRWKGTNNAREDLFASGHGVLKEMGLVF